MSHDDEALRERVAEKRAAIGRVRTLLRDGTVPDERVALARNALGRKARRAGTLALLLGERDEAREWFERATVETLSGLRERRRHLPEGQDDWETEPFVLRNAMYAAVLSDDDELVDAAATAADADLLTPAYLDAYPQTAPWYHWAHALSAVLGGETGDPAEHVVALQESAADLDRTLRTTVEGVATALGGLVDGDDARLRDGVGTVLDAHEASIDGEPHRTPDLVTLHGTVLVALARQRGTAVGVMSRYIATPP